MAQATTEFLAKIASARKDLRGTAGPQLHSQKRRDELRGLVQLYFERVRPQIAANQEGDEGVAAVDALMQNLLLLCHKRGATSRYMSILKEARSAVILLDARAMAFAGNRRQQQSIPKVDGKIIRTLKELVPSASLSYHQALLDLDQDKRHSWRGPATDLREALRETLDHLAPDEEVKAMPGYKQDTSVDGPTMVQKVRFVLKNRGLSKTATTPAEAATNAVETALGTFVRSVYQRSNVSTHTPTEKAEVLRIRDFVRVVLCELLEIQN